MPMWQSRHARLLWTLFSKRGRSTSWHPAHSCPLAGGAADTDVVRISESIPARTKDIGASRWATIQIREALEFLFCAWANPCPGDWLRATLVVTKYRLRCCDSFLGTKDGAVAVTNRPVQFWLLCIGSHGDPTPQSHCCFAMTACAVASITTHLRHPDLAAFRGVDCPMLINVEH